MLIKKLLSIALLSVGVSTSSLVWAQSNSDPLAPIEGSTGQQDFFAAKNPANLDSSNQNFDQASYEVRALLEPKQSAVVSSEMTGKISRLHKRSGDRFIKGDRLVSFDCSSRKVEQGRLKAKQNSAKLIYENALQLQTLNSIGELDVKLAEAETFIAKAELSMVSLDVKRCGLNAPFTGRVIDVGRRQHEWIDIGQPLMEIFNDTEFNLKMLVPSNWLLWLKMGTNFEVYIDETGKNYTAKITKIGARIDPVSRSVTVRGKTDEHDIGFIHSMSGTARFTPAN